MAHRENLGTDPCLHLDAPVLASVQPHEPHPARWHVNSFTNGHEPATREPDPWRHRGPHPPVRCPCLQRLTTGAARGVSRHRPRPVLPRRHHRARASSRSRRQGRLPECHGQGAVPRVRPRHQPGLRHLGRHLRGGAPQAPPPVARRPAPRQLTPPFRIPQHRRPPRGRPRGGRSDAFRDAAGSSAGYWWTGTDSARPCPAVVGAVAAADLDRAGQLARHERAHDRQPQAGGWPRS